MKKRFAVGVLCTAAVATLTGGAMWLWEFVADGDITDVYSR